MISVDDVRKVSELSNKLQEIVSLQGELTTSDYQGALEAVILQAISYGKNNS